MEGFDPLAVPFPLDFGFADFDGAAPILKEGSLSFTISTALLAAFTVEDEIRDFPSAARLPIIVPATPPITAPTGPAIAPPMTAPVTPPAVCLDTGRFDPPG